LLSSGRTAAFGRHDASRNDLKKQTPPAHPVLAFSDHRGSHHAERVPARRQQRCLDLRALRVLL